MWNPQKAGYLLRNILGSKVVKTNLKGLPYQLFCYQKSYNELSDNYPLAKQRFQNLWRFGHDSELYRQYREIIRYYTEQGIIEVKTEITDNKLKRHVYYLPHQAVVDRCRILSDSEFPKNFQQVVPELDYLTEHEKETVVQERKKLPEADGSEETVLLNSDSSSILDELLELSNNYFKVINILSYIFRFNYNCRNKSKKFGPLTVAEFKESEINLIKHGQRSLFDKKRNSK
ncbi:integrase catalytic domain-containing protein [Trichonephila clavipes]|nr:integrase catalytic domain-containing protein [Trichonephila clavipes]